MAFLQYQVTHSADLFVTLDTLIPDIFTILRVPSCADSLQVVMLPKDNFQLK